MPLFAFKWDAKEILEIEEIAKQSAEKSGIKEAVKNVTSWSNALTKQNFKIFA